MSNANTRLPRPEAISDAFLQSHGVGDVDAFWRTLRSEDVVMKPERLRAIKATSLSFARSLVQRMCREHWEISLLKADIDAEGVGRLFYGITAGTHDFHFAVASNGNDGVDGTGRFFETSFDFQGSIMDGKCDYERAHRELDVMVSKSWSGRTDNCSLGWTIANRSIRFFDHVVEALAAGRQPDRSYLARGGGYVIRNAGWYGNGRHGTRSWQSLPKDHPFASPYHLDLFALYLWRIVGFDVAEAAATKRNVSAPAIKDDIKRIMGVGNSSGIGMVAALVRWPQWFGSFNLIRELSLAFATATPAVHGAEAQQRFVGLLRKAASYYGEQPNCDVAEIERSDRMAHLLAGLADEAEAFLEGRERGATPGSFWKWIRQAGERTGSPEVAEQVNSLLIEMQPAFAQGVSALLKELMAESRMVDPRMTVALLRHLLAERYRWALGLDLRAPGARKYFWYKSEENGENRRGERAVDPGVENESFVDVAGTIQRLSEALAPLRDDLTVGEFLFSHPQFAHAVGRCQLAARMPYTEIRANILHADFLPMDGIRFLLSTMGLESSHPNNTRWVRGVFLQGAPLADEIGRVHDPDWLFPSTTNSQAHSFANAGQV